MKKLYFLLLLMILLFGDSYCGQAQSNYGLSFNGTTNYVSTAAFVVPVSGAFTVEFWAYTTTYSGYREFVSQGASGTAFYVGTTDASGVIRCGDLWGATGIVMPLNQWVHLAVVRSAAGAGSLYLNGVLAATKASGYSVGSGGTAFELGLQYNGSSEYLNGKLDEVRVSNIVRTAQQIRNGVYGTVATNAAGLIAYYKMNEGKGQIVSDMTVSGFNGTLGANTGVGADDPTWFNSPIQSGNNALAFSAAATNYIVTGNNSNLPSGNSPRTIECWINILTNTSTGSLCEWGFLGLKQRFGLLVVNNMLYMVGQDMDLPGTTVMPNNSWHHVALVFDGTTVSLYVDGHLDVSSTTGNVNGQVYDNHFSNIATPANTPVYMGVTTQNGTTTKELFDGQLDEVRIWNVARSAAQLQANMDYTLLGNEPNLVALYSFNQGNPGNTNTGLITAMDNTLNNQAGTLQNFSLGGTTSNWVAHMLTLLPVSLSSFSARAKGSRVELKWQTQQELNSTSFTIERSGDGQNFVAIGSVGAGGYSNTVRDYQYTDATPLKGINYYRLKEVDRDNQYSYSRVSRVLLTTGNWLQLDNNPVTERLSVTMYSITGGELQINVVNSSGQNIYNGKMELTEGINHLIVPLTQLTHGQYFLQTSISGWRKTTRFSRS